MTPHLRCSKNYAKRILTAVKDGTVEDVKKRKKQKTAITETEWPKRILDALLLQVHTRMQPGGATISIAYGVKRPKIWMKKAKYQFLREVREQYPDETWPSLSTLRQLIPANYLRPKEGDRENNVCVRHSNLEKQSKGLRPFIPSLPVHSREQCALVMCPPSATNVFSVMDPLTWRKECALRWELQDSWLYLNFFLTRLAGIATVFLWIVGNALLNY